MGSVTTMAGSHSGTGNWTNVTTYVFPVSGNIIGLCFAVSDDSDADGDAVMVNITFSATPSSPNDGETASIAHIRKNFQLATNGAVVNGVNHYMSLPEVPVKAGERVYMHCSAIAGVSVVLAVQLHISTTIPGLRQ